MKMLAINRIITTFQDQTEARNIEKKLFARPNKHPCMNNLIQRHQRNNEKVKPQSKAQPCEETKKVPLSPLISDKIITIDSEICQKEEESLIKFLRNNKHIFV
jgi:hypothetical protein